MYNRKITKLMLLFFAIFLAAKSIYAFDLTDIKKRGVIRHLGVPYANFVTGAGDGFSVDLVKLFAKYINVKYEFVKTDWKHVIPDLIGKKIEVKGNQVKILGDAPIKGDIIATGLTVLDWRKKLVSYSSPVFPTQIWLISRSDSKLTPIKPTGDISKDILAVLLKLKGRSVLDVPATCLDASLYGLKKYGAKIIDFNKNLNELAPAVINGKADATLLDVPDALVALEKFPGLIKVIGPLSKRQVMACAFQKDATELKRTFEEFLDKIKKDGTYIKLVKKYYPAVLDYYPDFFGYGRQGER